MDAVDDDNQDGNYRRRNNERGDYSSPRREIRGMGQQQGAYAPQVPQSTLQQKFKESLWQIGAADVRFPALAWTTTRS